MLHRRRSEILQKGPAAIEENLETVLYVLSLFLCVWYNEHVIVDFRYPVMEAYTDGNSYFKNKKTMLKTV